MMAQVSRTWVSFRPRDRYDFSGIAGQGGQYVRENIGKGPDSALNPGQTINGIIRKTLGEHPEIPS
jgi:hypothetical protein